MTDQQVTLTNCNDFLCYFASKNFDLAGMGLSLGELHLFTRTRQLARAARAGDGLFDDIIEYRVQYMRRYATQYRDECVQDMRVDVAHRGVEPRLGLLHVQAHRCELLLLSQNGLRGICAVCLGRWIKQRLCSREKKVSYSLLMSFFAEQYGQIEVFIDDLCPEFPRRLGLCFLVS